MKKKKYIVAIVLIVGLILCLIGFWRFNKVDEWEHILTDLKKDNPNWRPNTKKNKDSGVQQCKEGLVIGLCGPDLKNLSSLNPYNFYYVGLIDVEIENLNFLKKSDKLEKLFIASAPSLKDISILHNTKLKNLCLSRTGVEDISILKKLPLEKFTLSSYEIADISPLGKIKTLQWVDFFGCKNLKDISVLTGLPALKNIVLSNSGVEDLTPLKGMTLDYLNIRNTPASKKPLPKGLKVKKILK